jgi:hypothetical protein
MLCIAGYLVTQGVFVVGSVYFRKLAFIKTNLYLWLFGILVLILVAFTAWLLFRDFTVGSRIDLQPYFQRLGESGELQAVLEPLARRFCLPAKVLFWGLLAPVCWLISYLRLRETEV